MIYYEIEGSEAPTALSLLRVLGRLGATAALADPSWRSLAWWSRFRRRGRSRGTESPFVIPASDKAVFLRSSEKERGLLFDKAKLNELASASGFRVPWFTFLEGGACLPDVKDNEAGLWILRPRFAVQSSGEPATKEDIWIGDDLDRGKRFAEAKARLASSYLLQHFVAADSDMKLAEVFGAASDGSLVGGIGLAVKDLIYPQRLGSSALLSAGGPVSGWLRERVAELIAKTHHTGFFDLELFVTPREATFIEINFRAGVPMAASVFLGFDPSPFLDRSAMPEMPLLLGDIAYAREPSLFALAPERLPYSETLRMARRARTRYLYERTDPGPLFGYLFLKALGRFR